jgi:protein disulfide-isomerase
LAKKHNLSDSLEELLFKAYLTEGKEHKWFANLKQTWIRSGLEFKAIEAVLKSDVYAKEVKADILEAQSIGVQGVPFCFDNKCSIWAQHVNFRKNLKKYGKKASLSQNQRFCPQPMPIVADQMAVTKL